MNKPKSDRRPQVSSETRDRIKDSARQLFIDRGIDNVSVRQIAIAAGQRHIGAVGYYFQSKGALVQEIMSDAATLIDRRRTEMLDDLLNRKGSLDVRDIVVIIVRSFAEANAENSDNYLRFFTLFSTRNQDIFVATVLNHLDHGFRRCVEQLRILLPNFSRSHLNERILCLMFAVGNALAAREAACEESGKSDNLISARLLLSNSFIDTLIDFCTSGLSE